MLFNSLGYLIFLPVVVALFWVSPQRLRVPLLLLASYVFYMTWKPVYGLLIFALTIINYFFGLAINSARKRERNESAVMAESPPPEARHSKLWLVFAVTCNLFILGYFKYAYFAHDLVDQALAPWHIQLPDIATEIILPLGISFFVFEFIHYVTDVYRGGQPVRSFAAFALFASFFPTQIAGPIKRYQDFIPQLATTKKFDLPSFDQGINLILFGLFKKVIFADNLSVVVQSTFSHPELLSSLDMWLSVYAFAFQIYFDFSGYTDIARGSAMLIGFKVPANFNLPYMSSSISEFWHRWHISLSTWLRDYLYIPLGGSKSGIRRTYVNLFLTMLLGGLWHGAAMHFLVWGAYQGVMLVAHREFKRLTVQSAWIKSALGSKVGQVFSVLLTFHIVCIGWVFFRSESFAQSGAILSRLFGLCQFAPGLAPVSLTLPATSAPVIFALLPLALALLVSGQIVSAAIDKRAITFARVPTTLRAVWVAALIGLLIVFAPDTSPRFIYFQF